MAWEIEQQLDRRIGDRKGIRFRDDYIVLWGDVHSTWRLYRMERSSMDGWASLIEHACPRNGVVLSGHWTEGTQKCSYCGEFIPDEVVTLWKIHNMDQMWRLNDT